MMKKLFAGLLCGAMCLSALTACNKSGNNAQQSETKAAQKEVGAGKPQRENP